MPDALPAVGFIGLGRMGTPMARRLVEGGYAVRGFDLSADARDQLAEAGGTPVGSAAEAASADVVVLMLPDSNVVDAVLHGEDVQAALASGTTVVDMSSSEPLRTRALAAEL